MTGWRIAACTAPLWLLAALEARHNALILGWTIIGLSGSLALLLVELRGCRR